MVVVGLDLAKCDFGKKLKKMRSPNTPSSIDKTDATLYKHDLFRLDNRQLGMFDYWNRSMVTVLIPG